MAFNDVYLLGYSPDQAVTSDSVKVDLALNTAGTSVVYPVTGTVYAGTIGGTPLVDATVQIFSADGSPVQGAAVSTNDTGDYSLNVPEGNYYIAAVKTGYLMCTFVAISVTSSGVTQNLALATNTKIDKSTLYGVVSDQTSGTGIGSATVNLYAADHTTLLGFTLTADDGEYVMDNLPTGVAYVVVSRSGYYTTDEQQVIVTNPNNTKQNLEMTVNPDAPERTVSGQITSVSSGLPINGAWVGLFSMAGTVETLVTDSYANTQGRFMFANVTAGTYKVKSKEATA